MLTRATSNPEMVAVVLESEPEEAMEPLARVLTDVRADGGPVAVLMDLEPGFELTAQTVADWLGALIEKADRISAFAVVARTDEERLLVEGLVVAAKNHGVTTPIEAFDAGTPAKRWLLGPHRTH
ncbi:MAG: hypothetical protein Q8S33_12685 [Myxococcales bacterium]|nr:hypothetical protein [Myxococcales bacterium]MDP3501192.1 hypothetical protein [Myxococcales bacterium]